LQQIWQARSEFWIRKVTTYPAVYAAAKVEAAVLLPKLRSVGNLSYRELGVGAVAGVQLFGAFCLGEMIGRNHIIGYDV
jgi:hypothetical protein